MIEKFYFITDKGKTTTNEWDNDESDFLRALHSVYKKIRTILFSYFQLNCLKKDTLVMLKIINI